MSMAMMLPDGMLHSKCRARQSRSYEGQQESNRELEFNGSAHEVVSKCTAAAKALSQSSAA